MLSRQGYVLRLYMRGKGEPSMRIYRDPDADLGLLRDRPIAIIGYGNQGRAQALNLRDSGLQVIVGNRADAYAARAREGGFAPLPIAGAGACWASARTSVSTCVNT